MIVEIFGVVFLGLISFELGIGLIILCGATADKDAEPIDPKILNSMYS